MIVSKMGHWVYVRTYMHSLLNNLIAAILPRGLGMKLIAGAVGTMDTYGCVAVQYHCVLAESVQYSDESEG